MRNAVLKSPARPLAARTPAFFFQKRLQVMLMTAAALLLAVIAAALLLHLRGGDSGPRVTATVNGEPIAREELQQAMALQKAKTAAYFKAQYGADDEAGFWTKAYGGEVPLEKLKKDALAQAVQLKVQQAMAKREGLTDDIAYASFLKRLKAENKRRANAEDDQPGVYGPKQYSEAAYYSLINSDLLGALKNKLEAAMTWSDDQLRAFYDAHAAEQFTERAAIQADTISVPYGDGAAMNATEAETAVKSIAEKLDTGMSATAAAAAFQGEAAVATVKLDADTARAANLETPMLLSKVQRLQAGQHTGIFRENGAYVIAVVTERAEGKTHSFEEVKEGIAAQLADEAYGALVDKAVRTAAIAIDHEVYDGIGPDNQ
ncbi:peptidyl-prolyl cis-trans isomerase [Paenibacillus rhizovicinus]|uniref:Peptidyl-prolyl cis-trans isomerase n=1 Tax=Paenibacillus rhizovicinus TaxID=2704463 RepID=A0A6C0P387_9BACL|nr:peptidyl-prolyl cis-trans isomerase [Paenibacillus rhizovicinus]QHW32937.1 peptidyl-prolyl cis-trans isomerase [Paenibacillus rhizovicinus]